jgi:hypothetical protein
MAIKLSTALVNFMMGVGSFKDAFADCAIDIYTGAQPANADAAPTGTKLVTLTNSSGALTSEVASSGTFKLSSGSAGSVDTVTVNSIDILGGSVAYATSLAVTATNVAAQINRNQKNKLFTAAASGNDVVITAIPGLGTLPNTWVVDGTTTTLVEGAHVNMAGGVNAANGLNLDDVVGGVISKRTTETWSGTNVADGTAGWFRVRRTGDSGAVDAAATQIRYDGAVATSGAQMNIGSLSFTNGAPSLINSASFTLPMA